MKNAHYTLFCFLLTASHSMQGMASLKEIKPDARLLASLVRFYGTSTTPPTPTGNSSRPTAEDLLVPGHHFLAKVNYGLDKYFAIQTIDDIDTVVADAQKRQVWSVAWYYYDQEQQSRKRSCSIL